MLRGQKVIPNPYNLPQQTRDQYGAEFCNWFYGGVVTDNRKSKAI